MRATIGRLALIGLLVGLLAAAVLLDRGSTAGKTPTAVVNSSGADDALARYGFRLREVSKQIGIDFTHHAPTFDPKLGHIMPQVAMVGASVSAVDFDRDGRVDLYATESAEGGRNRLYRNQGDGEFRDVAEALGLADLNREGTGVSVGSVWGDYDNDGYEDLFLAKWGRPEIFHNDGGEGFTRATESAGLPAWANLGGATWLDYDRDGRIDLFLAGYWDERVDLWHLASTRMMPESFEYARNGGRKYLLRNRGDGRFEDVTAASGIESRRWALCASAADLCRTGYPDLFVANDYGVSELFANREGQRFEEIGKSTGVGAAPKSGMNVAFGDIFNQGRFSIYVTNISEEGVLIQGNNLWVPRETSPGQPPEYENLARELGVELGGWSFGAQFGDLNNDGNQDLALTNGYVSGARGSSYWYDFSRIAVGHNAIIADAANWPAMEGRSLSGHQRKKVWVNDGLGHFAEVAQAVGYTDTHDGRAVALADLRNRGVLDLVVANQRGPLLVYANEVDPANAWIDFELTGTASNRSAIGAEVVLAWDGREQLQAVSGGCGFAAQNQRRLHFGLGTIAEVDSVAIRWPSGKVQSIDRPEPNRLHRVEEPR